MRALPLLCLAVFLVLGVAVDARGLLQLAEVGAQAI